MIAKLDIKRNKIIKTRDGRDMVLQINVENTMNREGEKRGSSKGIRKNREIVDNQKTTAGIFEIYNKERRLGEIITGRAHRRKQKQEKAASNLLEKFQQMDDRTIITKMNTGHKERSVSVSYKNRKLCRAIIVHVLTAHTNTYIRNKNGL